MLNTDSLAQLKNIKQQIKDNTPRYTGIVRAGTGRYGFVNTPDKQQFFISPDEMEKVIPGDEIQFITKKTNDGKTQSVIEKVLNSPLKDFCGQYVVKGKGHFVAPQHPTFNRWVFIPPKFRNGAKDGQLVECKLSQHPFPHGKIQAKITNIIGSPEDDFIESQFMSKAWNLANTFTEEEITAATDYSVKAEDYLMNAERQDHSSVPFITIDSATSRDLDDALFCEANDNGWNLTVAIADPTALIQPDDILDKAAQQRMTSSYMPGLTSPMLPSELSEDKLSLLADKTRPAMICKMAISSEGEITSFEFYAAIVRSHAKLNYTQVAEFLDGNSDQYSNDKADAVISDSLKALSACSQALLKRRKEHHLIIKNRPDYRVVLDEHGKAKDVSELSKTSAHQLVEECMVAANRSAADFMVQNEVGLFINHNGFRTERLGDIKALVKEFPEQLVLPEGKKPHEIEGFIALQKGAQTANADEVQQLDLTAIFARQLERSKYTAEPAPHMGMGLNAYTNFTSPLRRYNDLLVHRIIKQQLKQQAIEPLSDELIQAMQDKQNATRNAMWNTEQWLKAQWLEQQAAENKDAIYDATIVQANPVGITVRLDASGLEGFVETKKLEGKWQFNAKHFQHVITDESGEITQRLGLEQSVKVKVNSIKALSRDVRFTLESF